MGTITNTPGKSRRVLVVAGRYPERHGKGDQMRSFLIIRELAKRHKVAVLSTSPPPTVAAKEALDAVANVELCLVGRLARTLGAIAALARGMPGQVGWMVPGRSWRHVTAAASKADVVFVVTVRALRGPLPRPVILDHIDALSLNMRRRAKLARSPVERLAAWLESRLLRRWERRATQWTAAELVTAPADAEHLRNGDAPTVIPHGWEGPRLLAERDSERDLDVILTGNMNYPPNAVAARWLCDEILPLLERDGGAVRAAVVGRAAASLRLPVGIQVVSDVPDIYTWLLRARVAVAPLRGGTGAPTKIFEAAAAGAAIVATRTALDAVPLPARRAETAPDFAYEIRTLLENESDRAELAAAALEALRRMQPSVTLAPLHDLVDALGAGQ